HREWAEVARLDARRAGSQRWCERERVRARATVWTGDDVERRARIGRFVPRPRRYRRHRRIGPTQSWCAQWCPGPSKEVQFEIFKRELWRVLDRRDQLSRHRIGDHFAG